MIKQKLIDRVATELGVTKAHASKAVDSVLGHITIGLQESSGVRLQGFGSFEVKIRPARDARHPRTGNPIQLAERHAVTFRPHKALKEAVSA